MRSFTICVGTCLPILPIPPWRIHQSIGYYPFFWGVAKPFEALDINLKTARMVVSVCHRRCSPLGRARDLRWLQIRLEKRPTGFTLHSSLFRGLASLWITCRAQSQNPCTFED
jgi:hypothetical protein